MPSRINSLSQQSRITCRLSRGHAGGKAFNINVYVQAEQKQHQRHWRRYPPPETGTQRGEPIPNTSFLENRVNDAPPQRLSIVGQYELCVQKGQVTFMGSTLRPSDAFHRVFAASSHALPVIRCQGNEVSAAEILLRVCSSGLELLETLSPLFGRLWHKDGGPLGAEYSDLLPKFNKSTFRIVGLTQNAKFQMLIAGSCSPPSSTSSQVISNP